MHMLANMFLKMWFNFEEETSYGNSIIFVGEPAGGKTFLTSVAR